MPVASNGTVMPKVMKGIRRDWDLRWTVILLLDGRNSKGAVLLPRARSCTSFGIRYECGREGVDKLPKMPVAPRKFSTTQVHAAT